MSRPWWLGVAPAQATVECSGDTHRLRWEAGELRALDHEDPEAERALAALGGEPCVCVQLLDAWARHCEDPRVFVLASRGPADLLARQDLDARSGKRMPSPPGVSVGPRRAAGGSFVGRGVSMSSSSVTLMGRPGRGSRARPPGLPGPPVPAGAEPDLELAMLLTLGGALPDRLVATVAAFWRAELASGAVDGQLPRLHAALYGRVLGALQQWLGADLDLELELIREDAEPSMVSETEAGGRIQAGLPFGWIVDVWARGLAVVWGRFCLAAGSADGLRWELTTVGPDLGRPAVVTLQLPEPAG
jgi:hypothetical protein